MKKKEFYQYEALDIHGEIIPMSNFEGKLVMVVNTASECGFTPQYEGFERLYQKYRDQDFIILGFPCNQFGRQEPGADESIINGCVLNYSLSFPIFSKINVNGKKAHPIFQLLKSKLITWLGRRIKWNFEKFIVNRNGKPIKRFNTLKTPDKIEEYLLKKGLLQ
jgi:glutathione peroxidase